MTDVAWAISEVVGHDVDYVDIPVSARLEALQQIPSMNPHFLAHLEQLAPEIRQASFAGATDAAKRIGGKTPTRFETFVRKNAASFGA